MNLWQRFKWNWEEKLFFTIFGLVIAGILIYVSKL